MAAQKERDAIATHVATLLRAEREKRELSMTVVAERAGLSQQMVSYVEREMRSPTLDTLLRIAGAMDLDLADVLQRAQRAATRPKGK